MISLLPRRSELVPGLANPRTVVQHHLLPSLRDDRYAGLLGFIWLLRLSAAALDAGLLELSEFERLSFGVFLEDPLFPFDMLSPPFCIYLEGISCAGFFAISQTAIT